MKNKSPKISKLQQLKNRLQRLADRIKLRTDNPRPEATPATSAKGYRDRLTYQLGRQLIKRDRIGLLDELPNVGNARIDPFRATLNAVSAALGEEVTKAKTDKMAILASVFAWAHKRNVPSKYLIGEIAAQGGVKGIRTRLAKAKRASVAKAKPPRSHKRAPRGTSANARSRGGSGSKPGRF